MTVPAPVLEPRTREQLAAALRDRLPAFAPGWHPQPDGPGDALIEIYARFLRTLADRIALAPDKHKLAFLDLLGIDLLPAQAARAPVVFKPIPGGGDSRVPAGARLAAKGAPQPVVFETVRPVALVQARVAEVVALWPARDAYAVHTAEAVGGRPFTLWEPLRPVRHELYLAHDLHFALAGSAAVSLELDLRPPGSEPLALAWEWWDGESWRPFADAAAEDDGTAGLTRSGTVTLRHDCAESVPTAIGGWSAHWLRARTLEPLPPDPSRRFAEIDRIAVRTVVERMLDPETCAGGLLPDALFAGGEQLDATKPFFPLGRLASADTAFYVSCEDAFSRPGAAVEICFTRTETPQEKADREGAQYAEDVTIAQSYVVNGIKGVSLAVQKAAAAITAMAPANDAAAAVADGKIATLKSQTDAMVDLSTADAVASAAVEVVTAAANVSITLPLVDQQVVDEQPTRQRITDAAWEARESSKYANDAVSAITALLSVVSPVFSLAAETAQARQTAFAVFHAGRAVVRLQGGGAVEALVNALKSSLDNSINPLDWEAAAQSVVDELNRGLSADVVMKTVQVDDASALITGRTNAKARSVEAATGGRDGLVALARLSPFEAAAAAGVERPKLDDPELAWEYWDGRDWRELVPADAADDGANFRASGRISFVVGDDWERLELNGVEARWLRARLAAGAFGKLTLVSWKDDTHAVRLLPMIEPRPPLLAQLRIGYRWQSAPAAPQHTLVYDDFRWLDRTDAAAWPGETFAPFRPVGDVDPALYVGFDAPLPADEIGLLADVDEDESLPGPPLAWEAWQDDVWAPLAVEDESEELTVPGIVRVRWPGTRRYDGAQVVGASGRSITLADARAAAAFAAGDELWLASGDSGELVEVDTVAAAVVGVRAPLARVYPQGTLRPAPLPRFGTPRTWLRARVETDAPPRRARMRGLHVNAVWAAQVETVENELLGSGNGEPLQPLFFARTPVLAGEQVEVRELDGARAHVEYPLLAERLRAQGVDEAELRVVRDARTQHVTEVWVPWRARPTLGFSGPGDRHYTIERTRGRILFGDGRHGRLLPAGPDNVRARAYRSGGGLAGNVPAGAVAQVLSGATVAGVSNPRAAEGGAVAETIERVLERGPATFRHRRQAVTIADVEALAREASPAVAVARATAGAGAVTVAVIPYGEEERPLPTWQLRRHVHEFVRPRMPAALGGALRVRTPRYLAVGVRARIAPLAGADAGEVAADAAAAVRAFLHPLTGGPEGRGWPFGRNVHASDVAAVLERVRGVDYTASLLLLADGAVHGETVSVGADAVVAAGAVDVALGGDG